MVKSSVLKYSIGYADGYKRDIYYSIGYADGYKRDKYYCTLVTRMDINVTLAYYTKLHISAFIGNMNI